MGFGELVQSGTGFCEQISKLGMKANEMAKFSGRSGCNHSTSQILTGLELQMIRLLPQESKLVSETIAPKLEKLNQE